MLYIKFTILYLCNKYQVDKTKNNIDGKGYLQNKCLYLGKIDE